MSKEERIAIYFLLILIIILSIFLIYKISKELKYDKKLYNEIYSEYEDIFNVGNDLTNENKNINKSETIYILQNANGNSYRVIGQISIPKINICYPIICETTEDYLKIAPTKLAGPNPNEEGNFCIIAHNHIKDNFFNNLWKLENGDIIKLTDNNKKELNYKVYDKYEISETDLNCINQDTGGRIEVTLISCTSKKHHRLVVKCIAQTV